MSESVMLTETLGSNVHLHNPHTPQSNCSCRKCVLTDWEFNLDHAPVEGGCDAEDCECETVIIGGLEFFKPSPDNGIELSGAVVIDIYHVGADGCEVPDNGAGWE